MPRLGSESTSSRRHNPTQTLSNHLHTTSQVYSIRSNDPRPEPSDPSSSYASGSGSRLDAPDDLLSRTRAPGPRTRWTTRRALGPYGHRPLHKWPSPDQTHFDEMDTALEVSESNFDQGQTLDKIPGSSAEATREDREVEGSTDEVEDEDAVEEESEPVSGEGGVSPRSPQSRPLSAAAAKKRDKYKKKRAKARAKAKEVEMERDESGPAPSNPPADAPQELLAKSIAHVARMKRALAQMEKWQKEKEGVPASTGGPSAGRKGKEKAADVDGSGSATARQATEAKEEADEDDASDSTPDSNSSPSECETGPTEPEPEDRLLVDDKASPPDIPPTTSLPAPTVAQVPQTPVPLDPKPNSVGPHGYLLPVAPAAGLRSNALNTLASKNHNIAPDPPPNPVEHLTQNPWTMLEVLFLLELVAHFPPAEHGWTFIAEAYNNILITRPLQEWFGKQAAISNEEEEKMKVLLQKMNKETRQPPARSGAGAKVKADERGKAALFGSAEARAEANARAKTSATPAAKGAAPPSSSKTPDRVVTRLPFPLEPPASNQGPPPSQRIVPFPRRRPPLGLSCADASAFARVMKSAAAGVRPPSSESRAAMLLVYSATKPRFPVRTPWDCWHRWCTPWVVPDSRRSEGEGQEPVVPPMVLDYVAGNIGLPCGTWITQARRREFTPVPGTYPDVPGVMHGATAGYDPRPGMVSLARMTHLSVEKAWAGVGLGRKKDGMVSEEVLTHRRMKLPSTLAGIWPGKVGLKPANARPPAAAPASNPGAAPAPATTAPPPPASTPASPNKSPAKSASAAPAPPAASSTSPSTATPARPSQSQPQPQPQNQARPAPPPHKGPGTIAQPAEPFLPLPLPRKSAVRGPPNVPEGTLGNTIRPGIRAWFQSAVVHACVLERVADLSCAQEPFLRAMGHADEAGAEEAARRREWERERERDRWIPVHLRKVVPPPRSALLIPPSVSLLQASSA